MSYAMLLVASIHIVMLMLQLPPFISAVGKWHIGANTVEATPVGRGFKSHQGYWSGAEDYVRYSSAAVNELPDIRSNLLKP